MNNPLNRNEIPDAAAFDLWKELLSEFHTVGQTLQAICTQMGSMSSDIKHLTERQEDTEAFANRITILEEGHKDLRDDIDKKENQARWVIGTALMVCTVIIPVVITLLGHLHWK